MLANRNERITREDRLMELVKDHLDALGRSGVFVETYRYDSTQLGLALNGIFPTNASRLTAHRDERARPLRSFDEAVYRSRSAITKSLAHPLPPLSLPGSHSLAGSHVDLIPPMAPDTPVLSGG